MKPKGLGNGVQNSKYEVLSGKKEDLKVVGLHGRLILKWTGE
jgi:hypothetical protein